LVFKFFIFYFLALDHLYESLWHAGFWEVISNKGSNYFSDGSTIYREWAGNSWQHFPPFCFMAQAQLFVIKVIDA